MMGPADTFGSVAKNKKGGRLLVFCRSTVLARFREIFGPASSFLEIEYLANSNVDGAHSLKEAFYFYLGQGGRCELLSDDDVTEIIDRCRVLRNIDAAQANALVHAMAQSIADCLKTLEPDCIASQMVDEYVSHLVSILASKFEIPYFGFCAGYFPGSSLLLADGHGRPLRWREPQEAEVHSAYEAVSPASFRQNYNLSEEYSVWRHIKSIARYGLKRIAFGIMRRVQHDYWNIHYAMTPFIAERRRLQDYPSRVLFSADWREDLAKWQGRNPDKPVLYLPLSYFPEATIDYWVQNKRPIQYESFILSVVGRLSEDFTIVVKEHLHMMGARRRSFLESLRDISGVVSVYPLEISNHVVEQADAVLIGSGSPGIEASLRGTPVMTFCDTSYWFEPSGATFVDISKIHEWPDIIRNAISAHQPMDEDGKLRIVRDCMYASTKVLPGSDPWPALAPFDVADLVSWLVSRSDRSLGNANQMGKF